MGSFFVFGSGLDIPINLDEQETAWIILSLQEIELGHARFLEALSRIFNRGLAKRLDRLRFDMNIYVNDQHQ